MDKLDVTSIARLSTKVIPAEDGMSLAKLQVGEAINLRLDVDSEKQKIAIAFASRDLGHTLIVIEYKHGQLCAEVRR